MAEGFTHETLSVNGTKVAMLTAGSGDPLLFLHGAGTWHGFDFALPWAKHRRVLVPYHPGWGESGDPPENPTVHDYTIHYLEMIDQLKFEKIDLAGFSMGGRIAATFAAEHRRRVRKLVLIAPAGLQVPDHPAANLSRVPPQEIPGYLVEDLRVLTRHIPAQPSPEDQAARARENASFAALARSGLISPWLARWVHRLNMPVLIVWGEKDRILPVGQADAWAKLLPQAQVRRFAGAGHLVLDEKPESVETVAEFLQA